MIAYLLPRFFLFDHSGLECILAIFVGYVIVCSLGTFLIFCTFTFVEFFYKVGML